MAGEHKRNLKGPLAAVLMAFAALAATASIFYGCYLIYEPLAYIAIGFIVLIEMGWAKK